MIFKGIAGVGLFMASVVTPAVSGADTGSHNYCTLNLDTGVTVCGATEAEMRAALGPLPRAGSYINGRLFNHADYGGERLDLMSSSDCDSDSDADIFFPQLTGFWENRVSSARGFGRCQIRLWENQYYGGSSTVKQQDISYVGNAMNDQASSLKLF